MTRLSFHADQRVTGLGIGLSLLVAWAIPSPAEMPVTTLVSFAGTNGANPDAGLVQAADGFLYGTTTGGGANNLGSVYQISPAGGNFVSLGSFTGVDGAYPKASLVRHPVDSALYGTASSGGVSNYGTIFRVTTNGALSTVVSLRGTNGAFPQAALVLGGNGDFYGTTYYGGTNDWPNGYGVVFRVATNGSFSALASFGNTNGAEPFAGLWPGTDGRFHGVTQLGGEAGYGTVFQVSSAGELTVLSSFYGTNGAFPMGGLVQTAGGDWYGTTLGGGANDSGTIFRVTPNGTVSTLVSFAGGNGAQPFAGLCLAPDGSLYGTTAQGGAHGYGTIYRTTTNGALTTLVSFNATNGANPYSGVIQLGDGGLYGTTGGGGAFGLGTVYRLSLETPPIILTFSPAENAVILIWSASLGTVYRVQSKTNLNQVEWEDRASLSATNATMTWFESVGAESQRFYRVMRQL